MYRGELKSKGVTLETALVVTPVESGNTTVVFYLWGEQPKWNISEAGCVPGLGGWKKDTLLVTTRRGKNIVKYKFSGDEASVTFKGSGGRTTKGKVALSEIAVSGDSTATGGEKVQPKSASPDTSLSKLAGTWKGRWSGGGRKSSISIAGNEPGELQVEYCYGKKCWNVEDASFADDAIQWGGKRHFTFRLDGDVLRGVLKDKGRGKSWNVRMKRAD